MTKWAFTLLTSNFLLFGHLCSGQTDSLYIIALKKADSAYAFKSWADKDNPSDKPKFETAKNLYTIALQIKPTESYPASRVKETQKILSNFHTEPLYKKLITEADTFFTVDNFEVAKIFYLQADSLYSNEYTKEKLNAISAITNIIPNQSDSIVFIKHGTSFGMCYTYCYNETKWTNDSIIIIAKSWQDTLPDKIDKSKIDRNYWQSMVQAIEMKGFYKLPHTIGCPDCSDGGAEWLIIGTKSNEWKVEFDYGSEIATIKNLLAIIRQTK